jgi:hypothetical protein
MADLGSEDSLQITVLHYIYFKFFIYFFFLFCFSFWWYWESSQGLMQARQTLNHEPYPQPSPSHLFSTQFLAYIFYLLPLNSLMREILKNCERADCDVADNTWGIQGDDFSHINKTEKHESVGVKRRLKGPLPQINCILTLCVCYISLPLFLLWK